MTLLVLLYVCIMYVRVSSDDGHLKITTYHVHVAWTWTWTWSMEPYHQEIKLIAFTYSA